MAWQGRVKNVQDDPSGAPSVTLEITWEDTADASRNFDTQYKISKDAYTNLSEIVAMLNNEQQKLTDHDQVVGILEGYEGQVVTS